MPSAPTIKLRGLSALWNRTALRGASRPIPDARGLSGLHG